MVSHTSLYKNSRCEMSRFVTISSYTLEWLDCMDLVLLHRIAFGYMRNIRDVKKNRIYINFISYVSRINDVYVLYWSSIFILSQRLFIEKRRSIVSIVSDLYSSVRCCHIPSQFSRLTVISLKFIKTLNSLICLICHLPIKNYRN